MTNGEATAPRTLWDRSRQLASREILEAALRLFGEQGYEATTVAQIAHEAGVSQRTLFRYFGTKEDLLGGDPDRFVRALTAAIDELPADAGPWEALRTGIAAALELHESRHQALQRFRVLYATPSLRAGWLEKQLRFHERALPLIASRLHGSPGDADLMARAMIATAFACLDVAAKAWVDRNGKGEILDLYDRCVSAART
ncbi:TetR/AcrR family transcriptional regulator [Humibacter albus]|uniref:TetR/AcrR family transcriptional regulator n=1 Tax=Humibacter albus TaxID=427754 RepID=UPI0003B5E2A9|nr:TetR/AcrR family transcriptional regulator [Humibacter albus]